MSYSQVADPPEIASPFEIRRSAEKIARMPRRPHAEQMWASLIFIISLLYLFLFRHYSVMDLDEGIVLQGAERILHGQVPYRDFFMFYTPGSVYLVALLFKVFGDSLNVARTAVAIAGAGCTVITYLLSRRVCSRNIALVAAGLSITNSVAYRFLVLHNWFATFFACLTLYAVVRLWESEKPMWALATGSLAALTTLIEQSKGAGLCLGLAIGYLILRIFFRKDFLRRSHITLLGVGFLLPWFLTFLYFGWKHSIGSMLQNWLWPLHHYAQSNRVFYGYQNWPEDARDKIFYTGAIWVRIVKYVAMSPGFIVPCLPLAAVAWLAYETLRAGNMRSSSSRSDYYILVSAASSGLLLSVLMVRADITHFMYLAPIWYVVLAWILGSRGLRSPVLHKMRPFLIVYVCIAFGLMSFALVLGVNGARNHIQTQRGIVVTSQKDTVIDYVQAHVASGDNLLVYPYLPLYNYLTETLSPAPLDFFQAGMNTPQQAQEIINSLKSHEARAVLFEPGFAAKVASTWPNTPLTAIVADPVADFIVRNYRTCAALTTPSDSRFQFMVRKDESCD